ncbi:RluA family pseudouridine synthase [Psychroflexus sediminis]|uniref:23S rRNA pseudouridine1911/1915/1917 synthase n=1 Tax=Psychroflexus sediminis TaxID=470826 RepID=A0A1G7Y0T9_9FLAO|nr:RluA family pseudouridine synthase [Psychroflexus sediminis]SDG89953.1 23S rRNA pseudouridine1911/1915/1917 synthase [Psychroflexus sediminis]
MQNSKSKTCIETHEVSSIQKSIRLQEYGVGVFESIQTKSALKKSIKKGLITRDGELAKTSDWVETGQVLKLYAEEIQHDKKIFKLKLDVLYEDDFLAVVYKPVGYPTNGNYFKTIENALPFNLKPTSEKDRLPYPQPVHRLDNPTSGVLLISKTVSVKTLLSVLFEQHDIQKSYIAIVEGIIEPAEGEINSEIDEKDSFTRFQVQKTFRKRNEDFSLVNLYPSTGRTHQIRIHLSSLGHPIVGDKIYGTEVSKEKLFLHASSLQFQHPKTQKSLTIETKIPHKFVKFINELK